MLYNKIVHSPQNDLVAWSPSGSVIAQLVYLGAKQAQLEALPPEQGNPD